MPVELTQQAVRAVLATVTDPEIPTISVVDLGMVETIVVQASAPRIRVEMVPTFLGCPALALIQERSRLALTDAFNLVEADVEVEFSLRQAWNTGRVSETGRQRLKAWGMAPPPSVSVSRFVSEQDPVACPICQSHDTEMQNLFGSAACRALFYCRACHNPFEVMKPM